MIDSRIPDGRRILAITHGNSIREFMNMLCNSTRYTRFHVSNVAQTVLFRAPPDADERYGGRQIWSICCINADLAQQHDQWVESG